MLAFFIEKHSKYRKNTRKVSGCQRSLEFSEAPMPGDCKHPGKVNRGTCANCLFSLTHFYLFLFIFDHFMRTHDMTTWMPGLWVPQEKSKLGETSLLMETHQGTSHWPSGANMSMGNYWDASSRGSFSAG